jgi:hypothetical protein
MFQVFHLYSVLMHYVDQNNCHKYNKNHNNSSNKTLVAAAAPTTTLYYLL